MHAAGGQDDRNFLQWLGDTVAVAVHAATQHESMRASVQSLCSLLEQEYKLAAVKVHPHARMRASEVSLHLPASSGKGLSPWNVSFVMRS